MTRWPGWSPTVEYSTASTERVRGRCSTGPGDLLAVYEPFGAEQAKPRGRPAASERQCDIEPTDSVAVVLVVTDLTQSPWPDERAVITIGAYDGVHLGHRAVIDQVRLRAEVLGARSVVVDVRPSSGDDRASRVGPEVADQQRAEDGAARSDRDRRRRRRAVRRAAGSRTTGVVRRAGARRLPADQGDRRRRGFPLRPPPRRQRRSAAQDGRRTGLRRRADRAGRSTATVSTSRSAARPSAVRWPEATWPAPTRCSATPTRSAGPCSPVTSAVGCSVSRRRTSGCRAGCACRPTVCMRAGTSARPVTCTRARSTSADGRRSTSTPTRHSSRRTCSTPTSTSTANTPRFGSRTSCAASASSTGWTRSSPS